MKQERSYIWLLILGLSGLLFAASDKPPVVSMPVLSEVEGSNPFDSAQGRPNIIFIMADDLGYNDLGCFGQKEFATPNIDKIAQNGIRFTQFYSASHICAPSRCGLLTGRHMGHASVRHNQKFGTDLAPGEKTIASVLKQAGYTTACIGKWGVGFDPAFDAPNQHGFDYHFGYINMWHAHNFYPEYLFRNGQKIPLNNKVKHDTSHNFFPQYTGWAYERNEYSHDLFAEEVLTYLDKTSQPFFLYVPFTIPHENGEAPKFNRDDLMEIPDHGSYADKPWSIHEKGKAAMLERMDRDIGRFIKKLSDLDMLNNTLLLFTSDNGGNNWPRFESNSPFRGRKRQFYEGGIRVPLVAQWPDRIKPGRVSDHIFAFWDVLATCADIAGVTDLPCHDGISFLPELLGQNQPKHDYLYWEIPPSQNRYEQAVRWGRWKAIRFIDCQKLDDKDYFPVCELYDLERDIGEKHNIASQHPEIVKKIEQIMVEAHDDHPNFSLRKFVRD